MNNLVFEFLLLLFLLLPLQLPVLHHLLLNSLEFLALAKALPLGILLTKTLLLLLLLMSQLLPDQLHLLHELTISCNLLSQLQQYHLHYLLDASPY